jgi:putative endonuclease
MKGTQNQVIGRRGESFAAEYLQEKGYTILERNYRTPHGEIDLIASVGEVIAFVEVKTRKSNSLGPPEISITPRKIEHMHHAAEYFIQQHPEMTNDWRLDVLTVQLQTDQPAPLVDHFENVVF